MRQTAVRRPEARPAPSRPRRLGERTAPFVQIWDCPPEGSVGTREAGEKARSLYARGAGPRAQVTGARGIEMLTLRTSPALFAAAVSLVQCRLEGYC
jgi:hypothetical protein